MSIEVQVRNGEAVRVQAGEGTSIALAAAAKAEEARQATALLEAMAESLLGPTYASTAIGLGSVAEGDAFAVDNGDGTVTIYRKISGAAAVQRTLATTAYLASGQGAGAVGIEHPATGSQATTILKYVTGGPVPLEAFRGNRDDTNAINYGIDSGESISLPGGHFSYEPSAKPLNFGQTLYAASPLNTTINKVANGDMFTLAAGCGLQNIGLQGNGSVFTGRGLLIPANSANITLTNVNILDMAGYGAQVTAAQGGSQLRVIGGLFTRTDPEQCAWKLIDDGLTATPRTFIGCDSTGWLIDLDAAQNTLISASYFRNLLFGTSKKTLVSGSRMATIGAAMHLAGTENVITGCAIAGDVIVDAGATFNSFDSSNVIANGFSVIDNSADATNKIDIPRKTYASTWTTSGTAPSLGNGTFSAFLSRKASTVSVHLEATFGSTSTFGTGEFRFSLPFTNNASYTATGRATINIGGTVYLAAVQIPAGASYMRFIVNGATAYVNASSPATFANGSIIVADISYEM